MLALVAFLMIYTYNVAYKGCMLRFVLQSLVYPLGISMDTLQANYSQVSGAGRVITLNRSEVLLTVTRFIFCMLDFACLLAILIPLSQSSA